MAHFFGHIQGQRGEASRLGAKSSGLSVTAASWQGAVQVRLRHDAATGKDWAHVALASWRGQGRSLVLFDGPVNGENAEKVLQEIVASRARTQWPAKQRGQSALDRHLEKSDVPQV